MMREGITVNGIVLSVMPMGEFDRRISLLTKERGRISAFAKGARKPNSAFVACTQTFTFGSFRLFPGKNSYTLMEANVKNYFSELRKDFDNIYRGLYFCEVAEYYTEEAQDETEVLLLVYYALRALCTDKMDHDLVRTVFDLRILAENGEGPQVFECVKCGAKDCLPVFSVKHGGMLCEQCRTLDEAAINTGESTLYALQFTESTPMERLFSFALAPANQDEFCLISKRYRKQYCNHIFKSEKSLFE